MKRILLILALLSPLPLGGQATVGPIVQPFQTFVDNSGNACSLCQLFSYAAGTTTPQATYTDSSGTSQNPNPVILNVAGGAQIWIGTTLSYKFVLEDPNGVTIWTVDNVKGAAGGGGALPCISPFTVQFANSTGTALACDTAITINPSSHALQVGGSISGPSFTLRNVSPITSSWTFDVTSPATALASLGFLQFAQFQPLGPDEIPMNASGTAGPPFGVTLPSGCTTGVNYSTATHTWACTTTGAITLPQLAAQSPDTVVMNASGASASPSAVSMPTNCSIGVNYSTSTHAWSCVTTTGTDYYFNFFGCQLNVTGNSINCQGTVNFSAVSPVVPTQPDANYYLGCTMNPGAAWGSSMGINSQSSTGFQFSENIDRYNGIPGTVTPVVQCHLHHL